MKELEPKHEQKIEVSVKQKKQVEHSLIDKITPYEGHLIWEINTETLEIKLAKFSNATFNLVGKNQLEVIQKQGFAYVSALNKKNAIKKFKKGNNGSKPIDENPLSLIV